MRDLKRRRVLQILGATPALASLAVAVLLVFNLVAAPTARHVARTGIAATLRAE